jgi:hypothetical protein
MSVNQQPTDKVAAVENSVELKDDIQAEGGDGAKGLPPMAMKMGLSLEGDGKCCFCCSPCMGAGCLFVGQFCSVINYVMVVLIIGKFTSGDSYGYLSVDDESAKEA